MNVPEKTMMGNNDDVNFTKIAEESKIFEINEAGIAEFADINEYYPTQDLKNVLQTEKLTVNFKTSDYILLKLLFQADFICQITNPEKTKLHKLEFHWLILATLKMTANRLRKSGRDRKSILGQLEFVKLHDVLWYLEIKANIKKKEGQKLIFKRKEWLKSISIKPNEAYIDPTPFYVYNENYYSNKNWPALLQMFRIIENVAKKADRQKSALSNLNFKTKLAIELPELMKQELKDLETQDLLQLGELLLSGLELMPTPEEENINAGAATFTDLLMSGTTNFVSLLITKDTIEKIKAANMRYEPLINNVFEPNILDKVAKQIIQLKAENNTFSLEQITATTVTLLSTENWAVRTANDIKLEVSDPKYEKYIPNIKILLAGDVIPFNVFWHAMLYTIKESLIMMNKLFVNLNETLVKALNEKNADNDKNAENTLNSAVAYLKKTLITIISTTTIQPGNLTFAYGNTFEFSDLLKKMVKPNDLAKIEAISDSEFKNVDEEEKTCEVYAIMAMFVYIKIIAILEKNSNLQNLLVKEHAYSWIDDVIKHRKDENLGKALQQLNIKNINKSSLDKSISKLKSKNLQKKQQKMPKEITKPPTEEQKIQEEQNSLSMLIEEDKENEMIIESDLNADDDEDDEDIKNTLNNLNEKMANQKMEIETEEQPGMPIPQNLTLEKRNGKTILDFRLPENIKKITKEELDEELKKTRKDENFAALEKTIPQLGKRHHLEEAISQKVIDDFLKGHKERIKSHANSYAKKRGIEEGDPEALSQETLKEVVGDYLNKTNLNKKTRDYVLEKTDYIARTLINEMKYEEMQTRVKLNYKSIVNSFDTTNEPGIFRIKSRINRLYLIKKQLEQGAKTESGTLKPGKNGKILFEIKKTLPFKIYVTLPPEIRLSKTLSITFSWTNNLDLVDQLSSTSSNLLINNIYEYKSSTYKNFIIRAKAYNRYIDKIIKAVSRRAEVGQKSPLSCLVEHYEKGGFILQLHDSNKLVDAALQAYEDKVTKETEEIVKSLRKKLNDTEMQALKETIANTQAKTLKPGIIEIKTLHIGNGKTPIKLLSEFKELYPDLVYEGYYGEAVLKGQKESTIRDYNEDMLLRQIPFYLAVLKKLSLEIWGLQNYQENVAKRQKNILSKQDQKMVDTVFRGTIG